MLIFLAPSLAIFVIIFLPDIEYVIKVLAFYYMGLTNFILVIYSTTAFRLVWEMYWFHHMTF